MTTEIRKISGEQTFPIYRFTACWSQKGDTSTYKDYPNWTEGLPEGRIWNSTSFRKMFREEKSQLWLDNFIMEWWEKYVVSEKHINDDLKLLYLKAEYVEHEVWYLTWFQHETFDLGQTNEEVLKSFEAFVRRKEDLNSKSQFEKGEDVYCLMGAEDRWRWHGSEPDGDRDSHSEAPCRCKYCKEQGVIRIGH